MAEEAVLTGQVKWWSVVKKFGFITLENGEDAIITKSTIAAAGLEALSTGQQCEVKAQKGPKGWIARTLISCTEPDYTAQGFVGAEVKFFNTHKGYGFAVPEGSTDEVFIHVSVLRAAGIEDLQHGQRLAMVVTRTEKGLRAAAIKLPD